MKNTERVSDGCICRTINDDIDSNNDDTFRLNNHFYRFEFQVNKQTPEQHDEQWPNSVECSCCFFPAVLSCCLISLHIFSHFFGIENYLSLWHHINIFCTPRGVRCLPMLKEEKLQCLCACVCVSSFGSLTTEFVLFTQQISVEMHNRNMHLLFSLQTLRCALLDMHFPSVFVHVFFAHSSLFCIRTSTIATTSVRTFFYDCHQFFGMTFCQQQNNFSAFHA